MPAEKSMLINSRRPTQVAHPFAFFAKGWDLAQIATAVFITGMTFTQASAANVPCGIVQLPSAEVGFYPAIAKAAHVSGQVILFATFDHGGNARVSQVLSGPSMLKAAAINFVEASKALRSDGTRECPIIIAFELKTGSCEPSKPLKSSEQFDSQHMVIYGVAPMLCDPTVTMTKIRKHFLFF